MLDFHLQMSTIDDGSSRSSPASAAGALTLTEPGPDATDDGRRRELGRELCRLAAALGAAGLCQGTGGNFSAVLQPHPLQLLVTPSGRDKRSLAPEDLLLVGDDARPLAGDPRRPSAEALLHVAVVAATGAGAVAHTHSVAATLLGEHFLPRGGFAVRGYEMLKGLAGVCSHDEEVWVPVLGNSQDMQALRGRVEALLGERPGLHGFLLAGHGLYTWGQDHFEARRHVEIFEFLFECVARRTPFATYDGEPHTG